MNAVDFNQAQLQDAWIRAKELADRDGVPYTVCDDHDLGWMYRPFDSHRLNGCMQLVTALPRREA